MRPDRQASGILRGLNWPAMVAAVLMLLPAASASAGDSMRCGAELVQSGDLAVRVLARCGEPDFVDSWPATRVGARVFASGVEQWYYNFGPARLIRMLRFRDGKLRSITSGGHGFTAPGPGRCQPADILPQLSKYRLLAMCGEPAQAESSVVLAGRRPGIHRGRSPSVGGYVLRDRWYYNFGVSRLLREVTLENGVVVDVNTTDDRGFHPH